MRFMREKEKKKIERKKEETKKNSQFGKKKELGFSSFKQNENS